MVSHEDEGEGVQVTTVMISPGLTTRYPKVYEFQGIRCHRLLSSLSGPLLILTKYYTYDSLPLKEDLYEGLCTPFITQRFNHGHVS